MIAAVTRNRVVVTGCGVVCALGNSVVELADSLSANKSGVRLVASDPTAPLIAAACPLFEGPLTQSSASERALFDPATLFAMHAAWEALTQSRLLDHRAASEGAAVYLGTAMGGARAIEEAHRDIWYHGTSPKPLSVLCAMSNAPAAHLAIRFGLRGANVTYSTACSSSSIAIGEAFHAIRDGRVDCALVGGTEACVTPVVLRAWQAMRIMASVDRSAPGEACKPFAKNRSGLVLGEGAALLVLERLESALERGAPLLGELLGYACTTDAAHICIPSVEGQAQAMRAALDDAHIAPNEIEYINAHGTGTRIGDVTETRAIREVFGTHAESLAVSSTKSAHGHLLGAAGALELVVTIAAVRAGILPATLNLACADPECDLDYVPNQARPGRPHRFMSNSFAFGGSNAILVATCDAR